MEPAPPRLTRAENMARIRSRGTRPELVLRQAIRAAGLRYRMNTTLPGRPDLIFLGARVALFVDGCFWHGCPLHYSAPTTRFAWWQAKLRANVLRDAQVDEALRGMDFLPLHIWQHEVSSELAAVVARIRTVLELRTGKSRRRLPRRTVEQVAEPAGGNPVATTPDPPTACACPLADSQVLAVSEPGSLRPAASHRPAHLTYRCRRCGGIRTC